MRIEIPKNCPTCDYLLELVNDQLFCRNTSCSAQLQGKLVHFCKTLSIKGFGPKTVEKLNLQDVTELFYLELPDVIEALGSEKTAVKLLDEIERSKSAHLATTLAAFSIPLVGNTASTKIASVVSHISEINLNSCKEAGLGDKVTANLLNWLETEYQEMKEFLPFSFRSEKVTVSTGDTVCITGKLSSFKTKAEANKALQDAGFKVSESVTKTTKYLVDEEGKNSTKRQKAESLGITIIEDLNVFLNESKK